MVSVRLATLKRLEAAVGAGELKGLARGIAWRLLEAGGVLDRRAVETDLAHLSKAERRALRELGVTIGTTCLFATDQLAEGAADVATAFAERAAPDWRPTDKLPWALPVPEPPPRALGLRGVLALGSLAVDARTLERLGEMVRRDGGPAGFVFSQAARERLGWDEAQAEIIMRALGYVKGKPEAGKPDTWRKRAPRKERTAVERPNPGSPFSALTALQAVPQPRRRRRAKKAAGV